MNLRRLLLAAGALAAAAGALLYPVGSGGAAPGRGARGPSLDLSAVPDGPPPGKVDLLFIHHSCGGQWLAEPGAEAGERASCILERHPNGGGLRARLTANSYAVHEASYGSVVGEKTDLFDWLPKLRDDMPKVLAVDENDRPLPPGRTNQVVVFKSCFPNSDFVGAGAPPGDPRGPELTVANAQATMRAVLPELAKHPGVLFVYLTAPPLADDPPGPAYRHLARAAKRRLSGRLSPSDAGAHARAFNDWMKSPSGWLSGYALTNVVVFDLFDLLTGEGAANVAAYPSAGQDSHPASSGNQRATDAFVPFLNRAVHRHSQVH